MKLLTEIDESQVINLTTDWMAREYDRMNQQLFGGSLGSCDFGIFTTGKGSEGGTLGWFKITGQGVMIRRSTRRLFKKDIWGDEVWVTRQNFVPICKPRIELNGNYRWTQKAALSTLVHEMCHYYCNMYGHRPVQHHGPEFRDIAWTVSKKSGEFFTVERIARAEQMNEMELNAQMQAKRDTRRENKASKVIAVFVFMKNGEVRLVNAQNWNVVGEVERYETTHGKCEKIMYSQDPELIDYLFKHRYGSTMRTYRYWTITNNPVIGMLPQYEMQTRWEDKPGMQPGWLNKAIEKYEQPKQPEVKRIPVFHFQTAQGTVFDMRNATVDEIRQGLKEKFPRWSDEAIENCIKRHTS